MRHRFKPRVRRTGMQSNTVIHEGNEMRCHLCSIEMNGWRLEKLTCSFIEYPSVLGRESVL